MPPLATNPDAFEPVDRLFAVKRGIHARKIEDRPDSEGKTVQLRIALNRLGPLQVDRQREVDVRREERPTVWRKNVLRLPGTAMNVRALPIVDRACLLAVKRRNPLVTQRFAVRLQSNVLSLEVEEVPLADHVPNMMGDDRELLCVVLVRDLLLR